MRTRKISYFLAFPVSFRIALLQNQFPFVEFCVGLRTALSRYVNVCKVFSADARLSNMRVVL